MGTIAVTGATGYLAEKLIERLITQGHTYSCDSQE